MDEAAGVDEAVANERSGIKMTWPGLTLAVVRSLAASILLADTPVRAAIVSSVSPDWTRYSVPSWFGIVSTWPTRSWSGFCSPLAFAIVAAETPYAVAIARRLSPDFTV